MKPKAARILYGARPQLRRSLIIIYLASWTAAAGCDDTVSPQVDSGAKDAAAAAEAGPDTGPPPDRGPLPDTGPSSFFCGVVKNLAGETVVGAAIILCHDTLGCHNTLTSSKGTFCVEIKDAAEYLFHIIEERVGTTHYADVLFPVELTASEAAAGTKKDLGTVILPALGATKLLDEKAGGTLDLGGGLELVVPAGVAQKPPLLPTIEVAATTVALKEIHPLLLASGTGNPVLTLATVPLELTFTTPVAFELPAPAGLADGTALTIYRASDKTGKLESHGEATISGGLIKAVSGKGIGAMGWLLFYTK